MLKLIQKKKFKGGGGSDGYLNLPRVGGGVLTPSPRSAHEMAIM